jgi:cytochrome c
MFLPSRIILAVTIVNALVVSAWAYEFGRPATPDEIKLWDIDVRPDGAGLPQGIGTVEHGREVYRDNCEVCHGATGEGGIKDRLVGGEGSLASSKPLKTIGSYWPYATTVFDYIRRAMPYPIPGSLSTDDSYAVTAHILGLNGIIPADGKLDQDTLPKIKMPNRDGFIPDAVFKIDNEPEMPVKSGAR